MGKDNTSLGDRMKDYEMRSRTFLPRKTNTIIRVDGKAFHTFTKKFKRPFDESLADAMNYTCQKMCENIQGAKMGYVQSDEISILLTDYDDITTDAWFDGQLQKICSVSASLATAYFNEAMGKLPVQGNHKMGVALFDSRVFCIPKAEEVVNYFIWRQQDATRNSISMLAQSQFSHKTLEGVSTDQMQEMLFTQKDINWDKTPTGFKRGRATKRVKSLWKRPANTGMSLYLSKEPEIVNESEPRNPDYFYFERNAWTVDKEMPIISKDRNYVLSLMEIHPAREHE